MSVLFAALIGGFALGQAAPNLQFFQRGKASGAQIFAIINRKPMIGDAQAEPAPPACEGHVELRNVHFAYPARPDNPVFKDFSLRVPSGKTVALVGESGSGKSTVVGLIERFYDPQQGQVSAISHAGHGLVAPWVGAVQLVTAVRKPLEAVCVHFAFLPHSKRALQP